LAEIWWEFGLRRVRPSAFNKIEVGHSIYSGDRNAAEADVRR
jgi:hypothetical protein